MDIEGGRDRFDCGNNICDSEWLAVFCHSYGQVGKIERRVMMLFDFLKDMGNYEERKVDRYDGEEGLCIDTARVSDSKKPFETGIEHPSYNDGKWVIVETYDTKEAAETGHNIWVEKMTAEELPKELVDMSSAEVAELAFEVCGGSRVFVKKELKEKGE